MKDEIKEVKEEKVEIKKEEKGETPKMREIIIHTDGNDIQLVKAETYGKIELVGVLQNLIGYLNQK